MSALGILVSRSALRVRPRVCAEQASCAQVADRRKLQKELAQLDAEREMLQVQQEECAKQMHEVTSPLLCVPAFEELLSGPESSP